MSFQMRQLTSMLPGGHLGSNPTDLFSWLLLRFVLLLVMPWESKVHDDATRCGVLSDVFIGNAFFHAYGRCKSVEGVRHVFDDLLVRDMVTWNSLSSCYVNCRFPQQGLNVCREMGGMEWNRIRWLCLVFCMRAQIWKIWNQAKQFMDLRWDMVC